jgi:2Fe-2S ferredoxin
VWIRRGLDSLSEQSDEEMDRLDMGFDVRPYSRLGCQAAVGSEDLQVEITEESLTAFMDENPALRRQLEAEGKWPLKK